MQIMVEVLILEDTYIEVQGKLSLQIKSLWKNYLTAKPSIEKECNTIGNENKDKWKKVTPIECRVQSWFQIIIRKVFLTSGDIIC